tara:strand:- start:896 stop:2008 length:1113 start_codon:yes stop_codon:yes gene_type:complete
MYDVVIIGAGVVGLSIARSISKNTKLSVLVIEKEDSFGKGVSSRNSEVIHSGIYYKPNTLKAKYCVDGRNKLYKYCKQNKIWFNNCGKLVVSKIHQQAQIEHLYNNARENGVDEIEIIDKAEIRKLEPCIDSDIALKVNCTGIVSAHDLMTSLYNKSINCDHDYLFKSKVVDIQKNGDLYNIDIENYYGEIEKLECEWVINASGLDSDVIGNFLGLNVPTLKFLKGSYFKLSSKWRDKFKHLVYPLPDKEHGSLGIHLTIDADRMARLGPNADWIEDRKEDYNVKESLSEKFFEEGRKYIQGLELSDISPDYAGIRPKILADRNSMPDFYIEHESKKGFHGFINLIGIESPGLTASLSIGDDIARMIIEN